MVTFNRKSLIYSQINRFNHIYNDINFFVCVGFVLITIVAAVVMYFFSIMIGLWIVAIVSFGCALYYLILSFTKEKLMLGYYQQVLELNIVCTKNGIVINELTKTQQKNDYMIAYKDIYKVLEYNKYIIIMLKNEGRITLPNITKSQDLKTRLKSEVSDIYRVIDR